MTRTLSIGGRWLAVALAALVALSAVAAPVAAETADASELNYDSDYMPNPKIAEDTLTKEVHSMGSMSVMEYEDDNGDVVSLDATLNDSPDNPYTLRADKIDADEYRRLATADGHSVVNSSTWTVGGANATKGSVANTSVASTNVDAVQMKTDGTMGASDVVTFTFDVDDVSDDPEKRFAQIVTNVNTLDAGTKVSVVATDSDGDDKVAYIDSSMNADNKDVIANATGSGQVYQHQLGDLANSDLTNASLTSGDGTFNDIAKITVIVEDGDAELVTPGMNFEKKGEWTFGSKLVDTDDDDELETETITEPNGAYSVSSLDTLGDTFNNADVYDISFGVIYYASDLDAENVHVTIEETPDGKYPNFGFVVNAYFRLSVPSAYDLSHSGLSFEEQQSMPSDRYKTVEIAEGTGDTEFEDISSWTDKTAAYSSEGANVTLDSSVQVDTNYVYHAEYVVTGDNKEELTNAGGAPVGGEKEGRGGILGSIFAIIGSFLGVIGLGKGASSLKARFGG